MPATTTTATATHRYHANLADERQCTRAHKRTQHLFAPTTTPYGTGSLPLETAVQILDGDGIPHLSDDFGLDAS